MDVKTTVLTAALSAITIYAGLVYYFNGNEQQAEKKSNNTNNKNTTKKQRNNRKLRRQSNRKSRSNSSSSSSSSSANSIDIPFGTSSSESDSDSGDEQDSESSSREDESNSHEISSEDENNNQNSPRTIQDHIKILGSEDLSDTMISKKLDSVYVLLSIVSFSDSLKLLSTLNTIEAVVDSLNSLLALDLMTTNQNSLLLKLGLLLGNLLQYPNNQKKFIETRFISSLVNLINDDDKDRSDFSLFCLFNLSTNEEGATEIILSQGIKEINNLLESKKASILLKKQGLQILLNMCLESKNLREMISVDNDRLLSTLKNIKESKKTELVDIASKILQIDFTKSTTSSSSSISKKKNNSDDQDEDKILLPNDFIGGEISTKR
ncbi:hypothetical protein CYY_001389 [Polysphondylium violaceum]|uniref:Armadillo repeat-containing domain-containing protein n=1 Tax=Polysphondylium violaceum TaxID=133409 RepID=A0A8J4V487_9MYCE|nr:hypothetical protein CYY_001389 [Polysphondylium violaceum]